MAQSLSHGRKRGRSARLSKDNARARVDGYPPDALPGPLAVLFGLSPPVAVVARRRERKQAGTSADPPGKGRKHKE